MASIPPEFQPEVERIVARARDEERESYRQAGLDRQLASFTRSQKLLSRRLATIDKRLEDNNHLRRDLVSKEDLAAALAPITQKLANIVVVQQLGDGDYTVTLGDVTLGPEDLDELPQVIRASRAAREAEASARAAKKSAADVSTLRSLWVTAIATCASALVASLVALGALVLWLHVHGGKV